MKIEKLHDADVLEWLTQHSDWKLQSEVIMKDLEFSQYRNGLAFAIQVAFLAEELDHHPDIYLAFRKVTISTSTHSAGGLTLKDLDLAQRIDFIALNMASNFEPVQ